VRAQYRCQWLGRSLRVFIVNYFSEMKCKKSLYYLLKGLVSGAGCTDALIR
jgi:hypothetical protein